MNVRGLAILALLACGPAACGPAPSEGPRPAAFQVAKPDAAMPAGLGASEAPPPLAVPTSPIDPPVIDEAAIQARYAPEYKQCLESGEAAQGVTTAMATCIIEEVGFQNRGLNTEYQRVMAQLPATEAVILRKTQRRWINERDAKCRAAASSGGSIDRLNGPACVLEETVRRTMELEALAPKPSSASAPESPAAG